MGVIDFIESERIIEIPDAVRNDMWTYLLMQSADYVNTKYTQQRAFRRDLCIILLAMVLGVNYYFFQKKHATQCIENGINQSDLLV